MLLAVLLMLQLVKLKLLVEMLKLLAVLLMLQLVLIVHLAELK